MKVPGRVRSTVDEMEGLRDSERAKVIRHLSDIADSLPEHPSPKEAKRIVAGALKSLKIVIGADEDDSEEEKPKKKEKKEEKKDDDKEDVKEARKLSFKAYLIENA